MGGSKITADGDRSHEIKRCLLLGRKVMTNQWSCMDVRVGLWRKLSAEELMLLNCGIGEDSWESLAEDCKEVQPVHPQGNQSWIFTATTDAEAESAILWPPDVKNWLIWKDPSAGKDWRQEEKGTIEDEMVGWHHWLNGYEFKQALGVGDRQGSLVCYNS